jgi:ribonucrease Y
MTYLADSLLEGAAFLAGGLLGYGVWRWKERQLLEALELRSKAITENAQRDAESITRQAKVQANEEILRIKTELEQTYAARRQELLELEQRLNHRDSLINRQLEGLVAQEKSLHEQQNQLREKEDSVVTTRHDLAVQVQACRDRLVQIAHLSEATAKEQLLREVEQQTLREAGDLSRNILDTARSKAENEARRIISVAIQRYAGDHAFETTTATITLPNEEIKGRIIGREGRNIRAFEANTGVTVLIDDTPNAVVLSSFDPVRRQIAYEAMQSLILDGRIHPTRIEEVVCKVKADIEAAIIRAGEEAVFKTGLPPMPQELVKLLGRLKFRYSFSQNILDHSIEVAHLAGMMAAELGLDVAIAKRSGLLHDIGKAVNHEVEGAHAIVGADFIKRYGENDAVVNGVASHHGEVPATFPYGVLVSAADAISASRPGARSETMTTYIKRLEDLERIGLSFNGVEKCFAVQAGRELRLMVLPDQINDEQSYSLARNVARKIEEDLQYPGQIRVTVIRETRCVEFAK